ncbi:MAG: putative toxin-antitoxin system toxin component, PIN family [Paludibacter sp.]
MVLDTNVLLVSISEFSKYHWLYRLLIEKKFNLYITNEILTEYEEIISDKLNPNTANAVIRTLMELDNVYPTSIYFKYNLIIQDPDDDKFIDCAFASNCDFLVTNDKHFSILSTIEFPKITIIKLEEFKDIIEKNINR